MFSHSKPFTRRFIVLLLGCAAIVTSANADAQGLGVAGNLISQSDGARALEVQQVIPGSLAERLGILRGDVIQSINGIAPGDASTNQMALASGGRIPVVAVIRGDTLRTLPEVSPPILPGNPYAPDPVVPMRPHRPGGPFVPDRPSDPIELVPGQRGPNLQIELRASPTFGGLSVHRVFPRGLGDRLRFQVGDVITAVNRISVNTTSEFHAAYVVTDNRDIVLSVQRRGQSGKITLDRDTIRKATAPPGTITTPLKLKVFLDPRGQVTIGGGEDDGLGKQLGLVQRGIRIIDINGQPIRHGGDLKEIDRQIEAGTVRRLVIRIVRPDGRPDTVSYP